MNTPTCIALIPDGNRRWATKRNLPKIEGHMRGLHNFTTIAEAAFKAGIHHVVLWGASESNLQNREPVEVAYLFALLKDELTRRLEGDEQVRFSLCGAWERYTTDDSLPALVREVESKTAAHTERHLTLLFGYSGITELVEATNRAAHVALPVCRESIEAQLWTRHLPPVDLIVRTGVEHDPHLSDSFLPWQTGNAQLIFSEKTWPDFSTDDLAIALADYDARPRRKGA